MRRSLYFLNKCAPKCELLSHSQLPNGIVFDYSIQNIMRHKNKYIILSSIKYSKNVCLLTTANS